MRIWWLVILMTVLAAASPSALYAQEKKGRIGGFEDANAGKSSSGEEKDTGQTLEEEEESGGLFFDILNLFFDILFDSDSGEEDEFIHEDAPPPARSLNREEVGDEPAGIADTSRFAPPPEEVVPSLSFGSYPFSGEGLVHEDNGGKKFLGRLSVGRHHIDRDLSALHLNGTVLFGERYGFMLDFYDYTERLEKGSDHLQIVNLTYRYLLLASDQFLLTLSAGGSLLYPDGTKSALWGPLAGLDARFFAGNPFSVSGRLGLSGYLGNDVRGFNMLMEAALSVGLHYRMAELYGGIRSLTPLTDTGASFFGPEFGIRIWF